MPSPRLNEAAAAWDAYSHSRKAPRTRKAGAEFADPDYDLSVDWLAARAAIADAQRRTLIAPSRPFCSSTVHRAASIPVRAKCRSLIAW
jgi:hypothetical protein